MTVAIGLVCSDGVIVASDSMGSSGNVAGRAQKVKVLSTLPVAWVGAGSVYVLEEIEAKLEDIDTTPAVHADFMTPRLNDLRKRLHAAVVGAMRACNSNVPHASPPPGAIFFPTDVLVVGYTNGVPYFLEIAQDGQMNWHTDRGFYAVGSGGEFATVARALMEHHLDEPLAMEQGLQLAWRTIDTTIQVSSGSVGPPVQLAIVDADGARALSEDEVRRVRDQVSSWKQFERDALRGRVPSESEGVDELPGMSDPEE